MRLTHPLSVSPRKSRFAMAVLAAVLLAVFALSSLPVHAVAVPFGGRSLSATPCTCSPGFFMVRVGPPRPGTFMFGPGSLLFMHYKITPPAYQLGVADGYMTCWWWTGKKCIAIGGGLRIRMDGTSLY